MKKLLWVLSLPFFISCGKDGSSPNPTIPMVDAELQPYYQNFKQEADKYNVGYGDVHLVSIRIAHSPAFVVTREAAIGVTQCNITENKTGVTSFTREITVDPIFEKISSEDFKNKIFLHEMGRCAYHLPDAIETDINNIMHFSVYVPSPQFFEAAKQVFFAQAKANEPNWNLP